ncbi:hypothetical protein OESDEN_01671 [Oesophagostomum dentatum]|uniref:Uncharacterized protein n=1 Tax=Oesophagostomum dentatum TaxID=61180 RepID=A0A0B1TM59_OESDE|nr:hypothetical protein OESDEN_01671 [Oesophagostomum dentatum]
MRKGKQRDAQMRVRTRRHSVCKAWQRQQGLEGPPKQQSREDVEFKAYQMLQGEGVYKKVMKSVTCDFCEDVSIIYTEILTMLQHPTIVWKLALQKWYVYTFQAAKIETGKNEVLEQSTSLSSSQQIGSVAVPRRDHSGNNSEAERPSQSLSPSFSRQADAPPRDASEMGIRTEGRSSPVSQENDMTSTSHSSLRNDISEPISQMQGRSPSPLLQTEPPYSYDDHSENDLEMGTSNQTSSPSRPQQPDVPSGLSGGPARNTPETLHSHSPTQQVDSPSAEVQGESLQMESTLPVRSHSEQTNEPPMNDLTQQAQPHSPRRNTPERRRGRQPRNLGIAATMNEPAENYLGPMNISCSSCQALYFNGEAKRENGSFNMCCNFGSIALPDLFSNFPEPLRSFYTGASSLSRNFRQHIRSFNSAMAMASMGAQLDIPRGHGPYCFRIHGQIYHFVGPLTPEEGTRPQFGQLYILDTDDAAIERIGNPANQECNPVVMRRLSNWLHKMTRSIIPLNF